MPCSQLLLPCVLVVTLIAASSQTGRAQSRSACPEPTAVVKGELSASSARPTTPLVVRSSDGCVRAAADATGAFELRTAPRPQLLVGHVMTQCVMPIEIAPINGRETRVTIEVVDVKSSLDDATILVPQGGYVPPTYSDRQCRALHEYLAANPDVTDLDEAPRLPSPDSVIALVLRSAVLSRPLGTDLPLRFRYWNEPTASPSGVVDGRSYEISAASNYIIARDVTPIEVEIQVGSTDDWPGSGVRAKINLRTETITVLDEWGR